MLALIQDEGDESFQQLAQRFAGLIKYTVYPFTNDIMLSKLEDCESLTNLCLEKLHRARQEFIYDANLDEKHNLQRFVSQFRLYMKNILIDKVYSANLQLRKPKTGVVSLSGEDEGKEPTQYEPEDRKRYDNPYQKCCVNDMIQRCLAQLHGDARKVMKLLLLGLTPELIARRTGMQISRVRYLIYSKVQPVVRDNIEA